MKKLIAATAVAAMLAACTSSRLSRVEQVPVASPAKRITVVGNEVTLPDGSRSTMDPAGGFLLPNGDRVARDARGALLLPNGSRCLPDAGGYTCP
ncbi:MAG TPA: hypothetical protein VGN82_09380 [Bosea sp. (in: a-proteobacteria)]|jgi:hypothetical protein|uniref:hypothetical protein n=1 Tax=Bosea sp. (in: a-proteobacteria) TaxID=1871050 RepID=UPI002E150A5D|nr:hypothetical protein [Bosea sp. (in: a-proteobacteria)]